MKYKINKFHFIILIEIVALIPLLILTLFSFNTSTTDYHTVNSNAASNVCLKISIPAYFGGSMWDQVVASYPTTTMMIANGDAGPTNVSETQSQLTEAENAGIKVLGYVHTSNGSRPIAQVEADVDTWRTQFGITSIFFDESADDTADLPYYKQLYTYVHSKSTNPIVVLNMGWDPQDQGYMQASDIINTFEDTYTNYVSNFNPPSSWMLTYPASRFSNLVHHAPDAASMENAITLAQQRHVGYIYIMNDNQWGQIPTYWSQEVSTMAATCAGTTATPTPTVTKAPTATPTATPTPTKAPTATPTKVVTPTITKTPTPTVIKTPTPIVTKTPTPTANPTITTVPTNTITVTATPTAKPTTTVKPTSTVIPTTKPVITTTPTVTRPVSTATPTPKPAPKKTKQDVFRNFWNWWRSHFHWF